MFFVKIKSKEKILIALEKLTHNQSGVCIKRRNTEKSNEKFRRWNANEQVKIDADGWLKKMKTCKHITRITAMRTMKLWSMKDWDDEEYYWIIKLYYMRKTEWKHEENDE